MFVVVGVAAVADFTVAFVWVMELASGTINSNLKYIHIKQILIYQNLLQNINFLREFDFVNRLILV